jgi:hypothetical protein
MSKKPLKLVSLASALAALSGVAGLMSTPADAKVNTPGAADALKSDRANGPQPNVFMSVGQDLLGMIVTKTPDGAVLADHYSHSSHSSHSSHYSSR